jgi:hypothetical protein
LGIVWARAKVSVHIVYFAEASYNTYAGSVSSSSAFIKNLPEQHVESVLLLLNRSVRAAICLTTSPVFQDGEMPWTTTAFGVPSRYFGNSSNA